MIPILRILTVASACVIGATAAQADTFRLSHSYEPSTAHGKRADWIASEVAKRTEGRHEVQVFPSGQLGNERDVEEGLTLGTVPCRP